MPGKTPQLALDNYLHPLRQSLACVTNCQFAYTSARPNLESLLTLSEPTAALLSQEGVEFWLSFQHNYKIQVSGRGYKVTTLSYRYGIEDCEHNEIMLYHWHPKSRVVLPHIHIPCAGVVRPELDKAHMPTLRIAFEDFLFCLITEFHIEANENYENILTANRKAFREHSSWIYGDELIRL